MTTTQPQTMEDLYERLNAIGIPKKFIKQRILPEWWTDEIDSTPSALMQGALYLSGRLNLDLESLLSSDTPRFRLPGSRKFKRREGADSAKSVVPCALASRIAEMVVLACPQSYQNILGLTAADIRIQILSSYPSVGLNGLLSFCWTCGVPVIHCAHFPSKKGWDAMVACFSGRPVILVGRNEQSPAWLSFIIAHELGHILKGHLDADSLLIDEEIQIGSDDAEENEANLVAGELLLGQPGITYDLQDRYLKAATLANKARSFARYGDNDPGVIALNITWNRAQRAKTSHDEKIAWATGRKALKELEPDVNAPQIINQRLHESLDWHALREESQDYLVTMLGLPIEDNGCGLAA